MAVSDQNCPQCGCVIPRWQRHCTHQQKLSLFLQIFVPVSVAILMGYLLIISRLNGIPGSGRKGVGMISLFCLLVPATLAYGIKRLFRQRLLYKCSCGFDGMIWVRIPWW